MEAASRKNHFAYRVKPTLVMLYAYREFGVISRFFMLNEHGKTLEDIRSRAEPFRNRSEEELAFMEGRIYVELVERVCQIIEDFSTLCYALYEDLSSFPQNILTRKHLIKKSKKSLVEERLEYLTDRVWYTLLRYPDLDTLQFSTEDKEFLRQHYERNIRVLQNLVDVLKKFSRLHWKFYTKHKHANPLIYGIKKIEVGGESTIVIPAFYYVEHPESVQSIVVNYSMYKKQREIVNTVINLMKDLIDRAISFIERDGKAIIESASYYKLGTADAYNRIQRLIEDYNKNISRTPINVKLDMKVHGPVLRRFVDFYDNLDLGAFDK